MSDQCFLARRETELDNSMLRAEVEKLRAVEKAWEEELDRSQKWVEDLREGFRAEKRSLEEKISRLEAGTASRATSTPTGGTLLTHTRVRALLRALLRLLCRRV